MANPKDAIAQRLEHVRADSGASLRAFWRRVVDGWEPEEDAPSYEAARSWHWNRTAPPTYLARVADVFGYRLEWLVAGEGEPTIEKEAAEREAAERARAVEAGIPLASDIRQRAHDAIAGAFPEFDALPPLAQGTVWRTFARLLTPLTLGWTEERAEGSAEALVEPVARALGRTLADVSKAFADEFQGRPTDIGWTLGDLTRLRQWQVEAYVTAVCQAATALVPNPNAGEKPFIVDSR